jgi:hypothetical protein
MPIVDEGNIFGAFAGAHVQPMQMWKPKWLLSEAEGKRSRDAVRIVGPATIASGTVLEIVDATATPIICAPLASGTAAAIPIYPAEVADGEYLDIAVIMRDCEVVGGLLKGIDPARGAAAVADLTAAGIIVR